jgi:hypothetical protein
LNFENAVVVVTFPGVEFDVVLGVIRHPFDLLILPHHVALRLWASFEDMLQGRVLAVPDGLEVLVGIVAVDADEEVVEEADNEDGEAVLEGIGGGDQIHPVLEEHQHAEEELGGEVEADEQLDEQQLVAQQTLGDEQYEGQEDPEDAVGHVIVVGTDIQNGDDELEDHDDPQH